MNEENKTSKMTVGLFSSRTEEWETPQYVYDKLNEEFNFDIDVCATSKNAKAPFYYTKDTDGLKQDWCPYQTCFMNPPYGKEIGKWMEKAYRESATCTVVCLVHARTDTRWWHDWAMKASEIRFIKGRLKFGHGKQSAPFPSCIIIFRPSDNQTNIYNVPKIETLIFNKLK